MAEAFLRKYAADDFDAHSAGMEPQGLNPLTIQVMNEVGIDVSIQQSKGIEIYLGKKHIQYLITVCDDADQNCPTAWPGVNTRLHWPFEDPTKFEGSEEERLDKFREIRDSIEQKIKEWVVAEGILLQV